MYKYIDYTFKTTEEEPEQVNLSDMAHIAEEAGYEFGFSKPEESTIRFRLTYFDNKTNIYQGLDYKIPVTELRDMTASMFEERLNIMIRELELGIYNFKEKR